jgi:hypothetical protein
MKGQRGKTGTSTNPIHTKTEAEETCEIYKYGVNKL